MRPRLFDRLDQTCLTPLTWIHAPAGSGKTTLATSYLEKQKLHSLWYTCKDEDNDLTSFFRYLGEFHKQMYPLQAKRLPQLQTVQQPSIFAFGKTFFHQLNPFNHHYNLY